MMSAIVGYGRNVSTIDCAYGALFAATCAGALVTGNSAAVVGVTVIVADRALVSLLRRWGLFANGEGIRMLEYIKHTGLAICAVQSFQPASEEFKRSVDNLALAILAGEVALLVNSRR